MFRRLSRFALVSIFGLCGAGVALATGPVLASSVSASSVSASSASVQGGVVVAQAEDSATASPGTVVDVAGKGRSFKTLVAAVEAAGLVEKLSEEGPFTILAPTDKAFEELPNGVLDMLLEPDNKDLLIQILTYHVVPEELKFEQFRSGALATLNGGLAVKLTSERIIINNASIIQADVKADNGLIQVISRVLIPPNVSEELQARMAAAEIVEPEATEPAEVDEESAEKPSVRGLW